MVHYKRCYYIYAKLTRNQIHIKATLSRKAPSGYYPVANAEAYTRKEAILKKLPAEYHS